MGQPHNGTAPSPGGEYMYETITCVNDPVYANIRVRMAWADDGYPVSVLRTYQLRRRFAGSSGYKVLKSGTVSSSDDLTYSYVDMEAIAGIEYTYEACVFDEPGVWRGGAETTIKCKFDGIILADSTGSWHSAFGTSESRFAIKIQKNRPVNYIVTLSGKFPHRVSNTQANYWTGTCSAIWLPWVPDPSGEGCIEPSFDQADAYRQEFMEWLMTDTQKLLKTSDGKAMIVGIDGTPQESYNAIAGMSVVTFDWTQIGEVERPTVPFDHGEAWVSS